VIDPGEAAEAAAAAEWEPATEWQAEWWKVCNPLRRRRRALWLPSRKLWRPKLLRGGLDELAAGRLRSWGVPPLAEWGHLDEPAILLPFDFQVVGANQPAQINVPITGTIPPTFKYIAVRYMGRDATSTSTGPIFLHIQFNGDVAIADYAFGSWIVQENAQALAADGNQFVAGFLRAGMIGGSGMPAPTAGYGELGMPLYGNTDFAKQVVWQSACMRSSGVFGASEPVAMGGGGVWTGPVNGKDAISTIQYTITTTAPASSWAAKSTFVAYLCN
jgi:hypothetical protein